MIPIFEDRDIFDGNDFKASANPLINDFQEKLKEAFINAKITGIHFDEYSCEWPYTVIGVNEYNKFYIFDFLSKEYPEYGFILNEEHKYNNFWFNGKLNTFWIKPTIIDVKNKLE